MDFHVTVFEISQHNHIHFIASGNFAPYISTLDFDPLQAFSVSTEECVMGAKCCWGLVTDSTGALQSCDDVYASV